MTKYSDKAPRSNEHYTPGKVLDRAREAMGGSFDLDPASCDAANEVVKADRIFTKEDDGLSQEWKADRLWCNPPYSSRTLRAWVEKIVQTHRAGDVGQAILLLHAAIDTRYGQNALAHCDAVCFPRGRLRFWGPEDKGGTVQQGQMLLYFGTRADAFRAAFADAGVVLVHPQSDGGLVR